MKTDDTTPIVHTCRKGFSSAKCAKNGYGWIVNKEAGVKEKVQRYRCSSCKKTFYADTQKYEVPNDMKQIRRLILELYVEGLTEKEIRKALTHYPVGDTYLKVLDSEEKSVVDSYIDDFFKNTPPHILKYLNTLRPKQGIKYYPKCQGVDKPRYSLYLEAGENYTAYALYLKAMPSVAFNWLYSEIQSASDKISFKSEMEGVLTLQYKHLDLEMPDLAEIFENQLKWLLKCNRYTSKKKSDMINQMIRNIPLVFNNYCDTHPHLSHNGDYV